MLKSVLLLFFFISFFFISSFFFPGCSTRHKINVAPVEVKPIHITIDVNIRVEKALDDFFDDIDDAEEKIEETKNLK